MTTEINRQDVRVGILTPYLARSLEELEPFEQIEQMLLFGAQPSNLKDVNYLETSRFRVKLEKQPEGITPPPLIIIGSTRQAEVDVSSISTNFPKTIIARYSIFYGGPSGYTGIPPEQTGYSLDLPKDVETARKLLTHDGFLEALVKRNLAEIRNALADVNKNLEQPILETPRLQTVIIG